ncbi:hypothetical protein ACJX0J_020181, partial [Zea mays]
MEETPASNLYCQDYVIFLYHHVLITGVIGLEKGRIFQTMDMVIYVMRIIYSPCCSYVFLSGILIVYFWFRKRVWDMKNNIYSDFYPFPHWQAFIYRKAVTYMALLGYLPANNWFLDGSNAKTTLTFVGKKIAQPNTDYPKYATLKPLNPDLHLYVTDGCIGDIGSTKAGT